MEENEIDLVIEEVSIEVPIERKNEIIKGKAKMDIWRSRE